MKRVIVVVPTLDDPAHARVAGALRRHGAETGHRVEIWNGRSRTSLERALRGAAACHVQWFSRGLGWLEDLRVPPPVRLVLTHQGASLELLERLGAFRSLARRADAVTCVSRHGLEELIEAVPEARGKASVVPNGVELAPLARPRPRARPYVLAVGRLAAYKGVDLLLLAFCEAARARPDLDLVVCGPDQSGGRLARFRDRLGLAGRVRFTGTLPPARVAALLAGCSFLAQPSRRESMPMALLEAMAAGKAVVASDVGGVREVVGHGREGLLIGAGDVAALTKALLRLAGEPALRARLGARARRRARSFTWSAAAARYGRLYRGEQGGALG